MPAHGDRRIVPLEIFCEFVSQPLLYFCELLRRLPWNQGWTISGGRRHFYYRAGFGDLDGHAGNGGHNAWRIEMPFGQQAIGGQATMQRAAGDTVEIRQICSADRAQAIQVEIGIAKFERIESPADEANVSAERFVALEKLQHSPDTAVAKIDVDTGHVRVQIRDAIPDAGDR